MRAEQLRKPRPKHRSRHSDHDDGRRPARKNRPYLWVTQGNVRADHNHRQAEPDARQQPETRSTRIDQAKPGGSDNQPAGQFPDHNGDPPCSPRGEHGTKQADRDDESQGCNAHPLTLASRTPASSCRARNRPAGADRDDHENDDPLDDNDGADRRRKGLRPEIARGQ